MMRSHLLAHERSTVAPCFFFLCVFAYRFVHLSVFFFFYFVLLPV